MSTPEISNNITKPKFTFFDFLSTLTESNLTSLPINHIANLSFLETIVSSQSLKVDYLLDECEVFNEHLLYFFYGKPSFRLNDISAYPICFVFKKAPHKAYMAFPFDSGAFYHKRMEAYFDSLELTIKDFEISGENEITSKIIEHFFDGNERYYEGTPSSKLKKTENPCVDGYIAMINDTSSAKLDDRKSSIELIFNKDFELNSGYLESIILPEVDFNISGSIIEFNDFKESLEQNLSCNVLGYTIQTIDPVKSSYQQIKKLIKQKIQNSL